MHFYFPLVVISIDISVVSRQFSKPSRPHYPLSYSPVCYICSHVYLFGFYNKFRLCHNHFSIHMYHTSSQLTFLNCFSWNCFVAYLFWRFVFQCVSKIPAHASKKTWYSFFLILQLMSLTLRVGLVEYTECILRARRFSSWHLIPQFIIIAGITLKLHWKKYHSIKDRRKAC